MEKIEKAKTTILIGHIEGVSYLLLMFVAMPLKYLLDMPIWVRVVGSLHGVLFLAYMFYLIESWGRLKWRFMTALVLFALSLIPFGTFFQKKVISAFEKE
ncbi:MAG: DUF3817 domain-containing protein [Flavobacteriales bacterium]|nr:DUF3817 domain-containing protein [Flavobacteriales bacterium]